MLHGWLILDKPLGLGSTQGVSAVKRALREGGELTIHPATYRLVYDLDD